MFIPRHHKNWKPEHMRGVVMMRDCYMCGEVGKKKEMISIKEGPMLWYFCNMSCGAKWATRRSTKKWRQYLKIPPKQRYDVPISQVPLEDDSE